MPPLPLASSVPSLPPYPRLQVSQELKGTLESELGINELREAARPAPRPVSEATGGRHAAGSSSAAAQEHSGWGVQQQIATQWLGWGADCCTAGGGAAADCNTVGWGRL